MQAHLLSPIVTAALQQCREQGLQVDAALLAYTACLLTESGSLAAEQQQQQQLDATAGDSCGGGHAGGEQQAAAAPGGTAAAADSVRRLVAAVTQPGDEAAAATARLQLALARAYKQQQDKVEAETAQQGADVGRLAAAVAYRKVPLASAGLPEYKAVFEGVVDYVAAAMALAARAAADAAARASVAAAVESVFPVSRVAHFLTLPPQERLQQLEALVHVTCGICLYRDAAGASAVPILSPSAAAQLPRAQQLLTVIQAAAVHADEACWHYNRTSTSSSTSTSGSSLGVALFTCQAAVAVRQLAADLAGGISCCQALNEGLTSVLAQVCQLVGSSGMAAVAKDAVLPLFESAGRLHLALTSELRLLLVRARLWEAMGAALNAATAAHAGLPAVLEFKGRIGCGRGASTGHDSSSCAGVLSDEEAAGLPADMQYLPPGASVPAVMAAAADADAAAADADVQAADGAAAAADNGSRGGDSLALSGFCPVSIARSRAADSASSGCWVGELADPSLGSIRYNGLRFGFASASALRHFVDAPALTLDAVRQALRRAPLLAHTLRLAGASAVALTGAAWGDATASCAVPPLQQLLALGAAPLCVDAGTQTPTHFQERHIDMQYEWNEWVLRRRIIALANLSRKATHSTQTVLSNFRHDGSSQTWQLKAAAVQTPVNKGSSMPRKLRYVTGLRGPPTVKAAVVSLELDLGQPHQF